MSTRAMGRARTLGGQVPSDPKRGRELVVHRRPGARAARGLLRRQLRGANELEDVFVLEGAVHFCLAFDRLPCPVVQLVVDGDHLARSDMTGLGVDSSIYPEQRRRLAHQMILGSRDLQDE